MIMFAHDVDVGSMHPNGMCEAVRFTSSLYSKGMSEMSCMISLPLYLLGERQ